MKRKILGAVIVTFGLALGAGLTGEAKAFAGGTPAIGGGHGWSGALQQVHHKKHKHHKHKHHHHHKKHHKGGFVIHFGNGLFAPRHQGGYYPSAQRDCHGVVKDGYYHGRYAKIGGTMCYDHLGRGYIVEDSRYVIRYY